MIEPLAKLFENWRVSTRVGGIQELVDELKTGLLVEHGNPKALAEALDQILTDARPGGDFGRKGREKILGNHS